MGRASSNERIHKMPFASVYPLYVQKVERKGRTREELDTVISWLTGYDRAGLDAQIAAESSFAEFFADAPDMHAARTLITGVICGVRVEEIEDPVVRNVRRLDKVVDELAKGRPLTKILRVAAPDAG